MKTTVLASAFEMYDGGGGGGGGGDGGGGAGSVISVRLQSLLVIVVQTVL